MLVSVIHIRMGAAQRNPSILFEAVAYVPLGLLRVLRRQKRVSA